MWTKKVREKALVACGRRCCICHQFCGTRIELHHIISQADGGASTLDNCIPLCFNCHADVGHYNPRHPRGTKYTASELRGHRDIWFTAMTELAHRQKQVVETPQFYEGQLATFTGFVWRETFPGPPDYESVETDARETYWMLVLPTPITLIASSPENDTSFPIRDITILQMILNETQYLENRHLVLSDASVSGRLFHSHTGHHHGDALIEVCSIESHR